SDRQVDEPVGTGLYYLTRDNMSEQEYIFTPHEDHPVGSEVSIDSITAVRHTSNQSKWEQAIAEEVDMMESGTEQTVTEEILSTHEAPALPEETVRAIAWRVEGFATAG
ncbi:MAG: hypothetical protein ACOC98_15210, partial [Thermodesulfobacteriota bacterium]